MAYLSVAENSGDVEASGTLDVHEEAGKREGSKSRETEKRAWGQGASVTHVVRTAAVLLLLDVPGVNFIYSSTIVAVIEKVEN